MSTVDPFIALTLFQEAFDNHLIQLQQAELDPNLFVLADQINGRLRYTFVRLSGSKVIAFVNFVITSPFGGRPCFQVGYAVVDEYRRKGLAKSTLKAAVEELRNGFKRNGFTPIYVEAIVSNNNVASRRVAEYCLTDKPIAFMDQATTMPSLQYLRKFD